MKNNYARRSFGLESRISSPRLCDRHPSLISAHGLKTSEAVQGEATAGFFSKSHDSTPPRERMNKKG